MELLHVSITLPLRPPHRPRWARGTTAPHRPRWARGTTAPHRPRWARGTTAPHRPRWARGTTAPHRPRWARGTTENCNKTLVCLPTMFNILLVLISFSLLNLCRYDSRKGFYCVINHGKKRCLGMYAVHLHKVNVFPGKHTSVH